MWQTIILSFLAGVMGGNAISHFVKGITKENYPSVLGNSPVPNIMAGWSALVITALLIYWAHVEQGPVQAFIAGALGVLLIGLFHAWHGAFDSDVIVWMVVGRCLYSASSHCLQ